jgi:hypothetical protein
MSLNRSTGLRNKLLDTGSFRSIMDRCFINIYSGSRPSSADDAVPGASVLLAVISVNGSSADAVELVTNGTFAADASWTKGTGWTISAGVASSDGSQSADSDLTQDQAGGLVQNGVAYQVTYTITRSAGTITPYVGGTAGTTRSTAGTFTETIYAGASQALLMRANLDFIGTVDNFQVTMLRTGLQWEAAADSGELLKEQDQDWEEDAVLADGTAGWFRIYEATDTPSAASTTAARADGTIGTSGADMNMSSVNLVTGVPLTMPDTSKVTLS